MGDLWDEATDWAGSGWQAWDDPLADIQSNWDQFKQGWSNPLSKTVTQVATSDPSDSAEEAEEQEQEAAQSGVTGSLTTWLVLFIVLALVVLLVLGKLEAL